MVDFIDSLYEDFVGEAEEKLELLSASLLELEKKPANEECINAIFRVAHTLKGGSAVMGFDKITSLTHALEDVFHLIRNKKLVVTPDVLDICFTTLDHLKKLLAGLQTDQYERLDVSLVLEQLRELVPPHEASPAVAPAVYRKPAREPVVEKEPEQQTFVLPPQATDLLQRAQKMIEEGNAVLLGYIRLKESVPIASLIVYILFTKLSQLGTILWSSPPAEEAEDYEGHCISFILSTKRDLPAVQHVLKIPECESLSLEPFIPTGPDNLQQPSEETAGKDLAMTPRDNEKVLPELNPAILGSLSSTLKVDSRRVDDLLNLVGELIINRSCFIRISNEAKKNMPKEPFTADLKESVMQLRKITNELQEGIMKLRMIKINQIFSKFPRLVRDISRKLDRKIDLVIKGEDTELDKRVIEEIQDPIMHIVRNCVDHGIESPETRVSLGKPEVAQLSLEAYHEGNQIIITIADDGKGIDPEQIKKRAVDLKLISEEESICLSDQEAMHLILLPGFSTTQEINDLSGRGVGMDVVKRNVERLNGSLRIVSEINKGTSFIIRLPLTLAIIPSLLVEINRNVFALPLTSVVEIISISKTDISLVNGSEMISLRDDVIPIIRLKNYFNPDLPYDDIQVADVAIVNVVEQQVGLIVDEFIGEQEVVIKSLTSDLTETQGISGASILGDGTIALIIDVAGMIRKVNEMHSVSGEPVLNAQNFLLTGD